MTEEEFELLEVKPVSAGWYMVTLYQFEKEKPEHPEYIEESLYFDGSGWDYVGEYNGTCYVCFIYERNDS